uniref:hypothetical protein n=1 Tax=Phocaeicola plebeius TaxID=310297 RepID=UPI00359CA02E
MEAIAQFLSSLKESEKSILITIIANALIIYLLCFLGIDEFKTYSWYQQLIIPCSLSIAYTMSFYVLLIFLLSIFSIFKGSKDICSFMMEDNYKWVFCIFSLGNYSTLLEVTRTLINNSYEFSIFKILIGTASAFSGFILLMIFWAIKNKNTPKN